MRPAQLKVMRWLCQLHVPSSANILHSYTTLNASQAQDDYAVLPSIGSYRKSVVAAVALSFPESLSFTLSLSLSARVTARHIATPVPYSRLTEHMVAHIAQLHFGESRICFATSLLLSLAALPVTVRLRAFRTHSHASEAGRRVFYDCAATAFPSPANLHIYHTLPPAG